MNRTYRTRQPSQVSGWGPAPGWGQPLPGWSPLVDHGPLTLRAAGSATRWWWPILAARGFLAIVVQVLDHDDPAPGMSLRGLLTIALAAAVVVLLTIHRRLGPGPLARAVTEYAVVAILAALLAVPGGTLNQQPADRAVGADADADAQAAAGDDQPGVIQLAAKVVRTVIAAARAVAGAVHWLVDLWRQADPKTEPTRGEAMAAAPLPHHPPSSSTWRRP